MRAIECGLLPPGSLEDICDWRSWLVNNVYSWRGLQSAGEVTLPEARQAQVPARVDRHRITVTILAQGTYLVTGEDKTLLELRQVLRSEVDAARTAGRPLPSVHVRADRAASYGRLRLVMRECVALGIRQMSFAAEPPAGETLMPEEE